ncbi:MAG: MgtC/SapB family protein [Caldilineaceae bacterium]
MFEINWQSFLPEIVKLCSAFILALPIAWEREQATRLIGLRTFPIVALASCGYLLVVNSLLEGSPDAYARLIQGLMTGIGFIGGGAILKQDYTVRGTATAASVWSTGAVGAAVAFSRYDVAISITVLNFLVLKLLTPLKKDEDEGETA